MAIVLVIETFKSMGTETPTQRLSNLQSDRGL